MLVTPSGEPPLSRTPDPVLALLLLEQDSIQRNILNAYVSYSAPIGKGLTFDVGKFMPEFVGPIILPGNHAI